MQKLHSGRKSAPYFKDDQFEKMSPTKKKSKQNKKEAKTNTEPEERLEFKKCNNMEQKSETTEGETQKSKTKQSMKILVLQKKVASQVTSFD